mgnify:CR=1 FL=1
MSRHTLTGGSARALAVTLLLGAASVGLYFLLFTYSDTLVELAARTRQGEKWLALVPLAVALVFSFVHGAFTGRFWELLGLRAKK